MHSGSPRNEARITGLRDKLAIAKAAAPNSRVTSSLYDAVHRLDRAEYRAQYSRLLEILSHAQELQRRKELLALLELAAPTWSMAIRSRRDVHGKAKPPGTAAEAWTWRQLHDELEKRASVSLEELQSSIEKCTEQIRQTTIELISRIWTDGQHRDRCRLGAPDVRTESWPRWEERSAFRFSCSV